MKRLALCLLVLFCSACGFKGFSFHSNESVDKKGSRIFKVDTNQAGIIVSLFGTDIGTPDGEVISSIVEMAQSDGTVTKTIELGQTIESGLYECLEAPNSEKRQQLLARLQKVQTSLKDSNYKVESVSSCPRTADTTITTK